MIDDGIRGDGRYEKDDRNRLSPRAGNLDAIMSMVASIQNVVDGGKTASVSVTPVLLGSLISKAVES